MNETEPAPEAGDAACWLGLACPDCGALAETAVPAPCWRCGRIAEAAR